MTTTEAPIVVGVDETDAGRAALAVAMGEAMRRGVGLDVVTAWYERRLAVVETRGGSWESGRAYAQEIQDVAVAHVLRRTVGFPRISRHVVEGDPARVLLTMARHAGYLVVGAGRGAFGDTSVLGSVTRQCLRAARCPVLIVPRTNLTATPKG